MKKILYILSIITIALTLSSCESETSILDISEELGFTGTTEDIQSFLGADNYQALLDLGVTVYNGNTPPTITGSYIISPNTLSASNIPDETFEVGTIFFDEIISFVNQDNTELSIDYSARTIDSEGNTVSSAVGVESFISGSDDNFTVIIKINSTSIGDEGNTISFVQGLAISGTKTVSGILNIEKGFIIITKNGDTFDEFIDEGEGRLLVDGDEISENI
jgi:hypothetical protein